MAVSPGFFSTFLCVWLGSHTHRVGPRPGAEAGRAPRWGVGKTLGDPRFRPLLTLNAWAPSKLLALTEYLLQRDLRKPADLV